MDEWMDGCLDEWMGSPVKSEAGGTSVEGGVDHERTRCNQEVIFQG
jgi:hypothetical protein